MANKETLFKVHGMSRDLDPTVFKSDTAYEIKNMRLKTNDNGTLLSLVNEKGTKKMKLKLVENTILKYKQEASLEGNIIGTTKINDGFVIFVIKDSNPNPNDYIYKISISNSDLNTLLVKPLYIGHLNFDIDHPIESLYIYENENAEKIYWVDGINQPRVINIAESNSTRIVPNDDTQFNFMPGMNYNEKINVNRNSTSSGIFSPGTIQYAFTYYKLYGQETSIFYTSSLHYISFSNRGGSPEERVGNSFSIDIENSDTTFDYIRVYSIHRSSLNATPEVKRVVDLPTSRDIIRYIDTGESGDSIDPTLLLYIGGKEIVAGTLEQKDETLFLGNLENTHNTPTLSKTNIKVNFVKKDNYNPIEGTSNIDSYYSYDSTLKYPLSRMSTFMCGETYRFGIQGQSNSGELSEPIWIGDYTNNKHIIYTSEDSSINSLFTIKAISNIPSVEINKLIEKGYNRIRPLIVFPKVSERNIICQGVLNPTVFNTLDRVDNSPYSQSSWFFRPYGIINDSGNYNEEESEIEFKNYYSLNKNSLGGGEIQSNDTEQLPNPNIGKGDFSKNQKEFLSKYSDLFFVDQSIVTFHSPDIEFDTRLQYTNFSNDLKLDIIGYVPITSTISDIDIQTKTPALNYRAADVNKRIVAPGFYKKTIKSNNHIGLSTATFWMDEAYSITETFNNAANTTWSWPIYPWHRSGSLNNQPYAMGTVENPNNKYRSAELKTKKMSNLRFSFKTVYFNTEFSTDKTEIEKQIINTPLNKYNLTDFQVFNSDVISALRIKNGEKTDINYYGNIDKLITKAESKTVESTLVQGYHLTFGGYTGTTSGKNSLSDIFSNTVFGYLTPKINLGYSAINSYSDCYSSDPISMKYKSNIHGIISLGENYILPKITYNDVSSNSIEYTPFWTQKKVTRTQNNIKVNRLPTTGYLYIANIVNISNKTETRFGGTSAEAIRNNNWIPCGNFIKIKRDTDATVDWLEGDTYYQRYDCLKTYPFTLEDKNSVVDILSFMCETRVNIDGRYDKNRGQVNNLVMSPVNFNLINDVYSQSNNFFNYRVLDENLFNIEKFPNSITWSKTKIKGAKTDAWTNITLASVLDLDGDKGELTAIRRFNNDLIAFQKSGISQILYNENTQVTTEQGVPIEIANSGKVQGKRYLLDNIGSCNKWSIVTAPSGLYFIDDINKKLYLYNGKIESLSEKLGLDSYFSDVCTSVEPWSPYDFKNIVGYYDSLNSDVLFINKYNCLAFSEGLGQFSSFYSYNNIPFFNSIDDRAFWIKNVNNTLEIWEHNAGEYNSFFGESKGYSVSVIANENPQYIKTFNTLDFRADSWIDNTLCNNNTFDTLQVNNEYQNGRSNLIWDKSKPSTLKKKFRVWNALIPRDKNKRLSRMKNTWLLIKLAKESPGKEKTILHDLKISYSI